ncbi:MAG: septum formation initiator family protein [Oscillospiraceae bacterium]|jgi:cell division protein FtsB|nr:septum formation initiator family protein [Oscillospiraceae bacterium]
MQKTKLSRLTAAIIIVLAIFAITQIHNTNKQIAAARNQNSDLSRQLKELQSSNAALKVQVQSANDPKVRENIARSRLGFILPGEIVFKSN